MRVGDVLQRLSKNRVKVGAIAICLALGFASGLLLYSNHKDPMRLNLITWWVSPSESKALNRIVSAFQAAGGQLSVETASDALSVEKIENRMMEEGRSPGVAQFNISRQFDQLVEDGELRRLDAVASANGWTRVFPVYVQSIIRRNGHFYAVPLAIHNYGAIFYSKSVFQKSGITVAPNDIDELIADLRVVKSHGYIPLAVGQQDWELKTIFDTLLLGMTSKETFLRIYRDRDLALIASPELTRVLTYLGELRDLTQPSKKVATWDDATHLLMTNQAAVQFMGDWAEGEFIVKGLSAGKDFGCLPGLGPTPTAIIGGDVWVFPKSDDAMKLKAQDLLAEVATRPDVQLDFSREKGSIPARLDVDSSKLTLCQRRVAELVKDGNVIPNAEVYLSPDENHAIRAILARFWLHQLDVPGLQKALQNVL